MENRFSFFLSYLNGDKKDHLYSSDILRWITPRVHRQGYKSLFTASIKYPHCLSREEKHVTMQSICTLLKFIRCLNTLHVNYRLDFPKQPFINVL